MIGSLGGPWLVVSALMLLAAAAARLPQIHRRDLIHVTALVMLAAAARLSLGLWGPFHVNGQGPFWIRGVIEEGPLVQYGPGYFELFNWLIRLGLAPDYTLFTANAVLSALSPGLLYATARVFGIGTGAALAAAVALAADPVLIRTAASEGYSSAIIFLALGVQLSLGLIVQAQRRADQLASAFALASAALLACSVARIHAMAYLPLAISPVMLLGAAHSGAWRERLLRTVVASGVIGAMVLLTSGEIILTALSAPMASQTWRGGQFGWSMLLPIIIAAALILLAHRRLRAPGLGLLALLAVILILATQNSYDQHPLQRLAYQRLFFPIVLIGAAGVVPEAWQSNGRMALTGLLAGALMLLSVRADLTVPTTEYLEYHFLRRVLHDMSPECTLAAVDRAEKRVWSIPSHLLPQREARGTESELSVHSPEELTDRFEPGHCLLYVHSSLCSSTEGRALCDGIEAGAKLEKIADAVFPARASYRGLPYDSADVPVVVYRVIAGKAASNTKESPTSVAAIAGELTPQSVNEVYARLRNLTAGDGCRLMRFDSDGTTISMTVSSKSGQRQVLELTAPNRGATGGNDWNLSAPASVQSKCPETLATIAKALQERARSGR